ncbi:hypothetical protein QTP70_009153 [Hemibagrus guttatus]|uniref:Reverse transcriptase RNase H-like domain-containing protein n=1 Tax=Hemibagrus guttatus TaxID=175788 RepID=A0AAE0UMX0_9TELE|nr:hypothetical protein QTP70_009153 [Hemibagrus guttatus]
MAPILRHPDPDLPFVVEVDASSSGLGAVLSQRHGKPGKLHPCAFYSRKLTSAEVNYDVGNRELLAIKAALEEWRHWLEGVRHPFQVLTDHRNLEYLRGAKRLNPRQARWAIFFTRFAFTVTYVPGPKTAKRMRYLDSSRRTTSRLSQTSSCRLQRSCIWCSRTSSRRFNGLTPTNRLLPALHLPKSSCHYTSDSRLYSGCTRPAAPDIQAFTNLPSSSAAGSGGPPWVRMWRSTSGYAPRVRRRGPVVYFRRGCWSLFWSLDAPGRTCRWTS